MSTDQMAGVSTSNQKGTLLSSADDTLAHYVEKMLVFDKRFKGMSQYVHDIKFWWYGGPPVDTACAGHGFIFFNPTWWNQLAEEERKTVIAHEIWHLISKHLERGRDKDPESYNIAGDHMINLTCMDDGFVTTLSPGGAPTDFGGMGMIIDERFRGMGTDAIYAVVHEERKKDPQNHPGSGAPSANQIEDMIQEALDQIGDGKDVQQQAEENEEKREQAVQDGLQAGDQPGCNQEILRTEGKKVWILQAPYEEIFEEYLTDPLSGGKRTYVRPSRRQVKGGLRLKGKFPKRGRKNRLTHLVYALDISGSITDKQKKQFLRSAKTLKEKLNPISMTVILWDTSIQFEKTFRENETLDNIHVMSGGGTCLQPVYARVNQIQPEALVIFTDLAVDIPAQPSWDTIWFVPDNQICEPYLQAVTYGKVYRIPED